MYKFSFRRTPLYLAKFGVARLSLVCFARALFFIVNVCINFDRKRMYKLFVPPNARKAEIRVFVNFSQKRVFNISSSKLTECKRKSNRILAPFHFWFSFHRNFNAVIVPRSYVPQSLSNMYVLGVPHKSQAL